MQQLRKNYPDYDYVFTGHSLGGALCVHAAADSILSQWIPETSKLYIYDYGQPRVGNKQFLDQFVDKITEFYRVIHYQDEVPHVPPCLPALEGGCAEEGPLPIYPFHAPEEIYYNEAFDEYTECSLTNGEDMKCSNSQDYPSISDHLSYYNFAISDI